VPGAGGGGAGWRQRSRAYPIQGRRRGRQGGGRGAVLLSCAGEAGGVLVEVGFRVETSTWTNWAKKSKVGGLYPSQNIHMDTRISTYKYPILNNGAGYVSTAYPMCIHIQSARDTGYAGYGTYPRRLGKKIRMRKRR
jgi:hypothetical protein